MIRQAIVDYAEDFVKDKVRSTILWWNVLDDAGYPGVAVKKWIDIMNEDGCAAAWCSENIGSRDYFRAGSAVYFTRDEDAVNFALRWA
jgi:hypothetical protein